MQILVLYYSKTGNTEKLARAVAEGVDQVQGTRALLKSTAEVSKDDFLSSQGVIAGSPVYFGLMAADLKRVLDEFISTRVRARKWRVRWERLLRPLEIPPAAKRPPCSPSSRP